MSFEYTIVIGNDKEEVEQKVNELFDKYWICQGGLSIETVRWEHPTHGE